MYLEAAAILPQFILANATGATDVIVSFYLLLLGTYRLLYILNWMYRFKYERDFDLVLVIPGILQTAL